MSYTLDANILLYASDEGSPHHAVGLDLVTRAAQGPEIVYLFWPTIIAYLRIATHPAVFRRPLSIADAVGNVEALIGRPHVQTPGEQERFSRRFGEVVSDSAPNGQPRVRRPSGRPDARQRRPDDLHSRPGLPALPRHRGPRPVRVRWPARAGSCLVTAQGDTGARVVYDHGRDERPILGAGSRSSPPA